MIGCTAPPLPTTHTAPSSGHFGPRASCLRGAQGGRSPSCSTHPGALLAANSSDCGFMASYRRLSTLSLILCQPRRLGSIFSGDFKNLHIKEDVKSYTCPRAGPHVSSSQQAGSPLQLSLGSFISGSQDLGTEVVWSPRFKAWMVQ